MATLREDLEATSATIGADNDSGGTGTGPEAGGVVEAAPSESVVETGSGGQASGTETPRTDGRDASGRFTKPDATTTKAGTEVAPAPSTTGTVPPTPGGDSSKTETPGTGTPDATSRPPPSWRHSAHLDWAKTPPAARAEAHRLHGEMQRFMEESAPARRLAGELQQTLAPIAQALQARGTTPQRLISEYVRFDQALSSRDPETKAQAIAQVMRAYGVPVEALADALDGKALSRGREPSVDEIREQIRQEERQRYESSVRQQEMSHHARQVQQFASSADADLFNDDIRFQMAALIEAAAARGVELSLKDAYSQSVWANPETRAIIQQREAAKAQPTAQAATQRAMAAGGSIKSRPASPISGGGGRSIREDLESTAAELSGR